MRYDLAALTRRAKNPRRSAITLRKIQSPATFASDLFAIYRPAVSSWSRALPNILATYERSLSEITTDAPADLRAEIDRVETDGAVIMVGVRLRLERWAQRIEAWQRGKWRGAVKSATGVDIGQLIGPQDARTTLATAIERNVALVSSVSDQTRDRIADAVFRGLDARTPSREVARELSKAVALSRKRALRIASDQRVKITSALNEERRREAGIDSWIWIHSGKAHPREDHVSRNGLLYSESKGRVGDDYEGKRVRAEPSDTPGQLPFCGCVSRAVLILD